MMHTVRFLLEGNREAVKVGTACNQVFLVAGDGVQEGSILDDGNQAGWCRKCHAVHTGRETEVGTPSEFGVAEESDLGPAEESELGALECDDGVGPAEEQLPDDPAPGR